MTLQNPEDAKHEWDKTDPPEVTKAIEAGAEALHYKYRKLPYREWTEVSEYAQQEWRTHARQILSRPEIRVVADDQTLPKNPIDVESKLHNSRLEQSKNYYDGKYNGIENGFSLILADGFQRVYKVKDGE